MVDHLGFPKYSRFYSGNISEPLTLKDLCVSRRNIRDYEVAQEDKVVLTNKQGHRITIKDLACDPVSKDRMLYVHSPLKAKKEASIKSKLTPRFEADMKAAKAALTKPRGTKTIAKVYQRIGRIKERHPRVAAHYEIEVTENTEKGVVTDIKWKYQPQKPRKDEGVYFLRTSVQELSEKVLWQIYSTLTEVEAAFRTLKTDLSIRPVYHQKDEHIEAHLFLGIPAYYVVAIIRHRLKQHGINHSWKTIVNIMNSQKLITTTFKDKEGKRRFIRQCSRPNAQVREVYEAMGFKHKPFTRIKGVVTQL